MLYYDDECCILQGRHCTCAIHWERSQFMTARSASPHGQKAAALTRHSSGDRSCVRCVPPPATQGDTLMTNPKQLIPSYYHGSRKGKNYGEKFWRPEGLCMWHTEHAFVNYQPKTTHLTAKTVGKKKKKKKIEELHTLAGYKQRYDSIKRYNKLNDISVFTVLWDEIISCIVHAKR